MLRDEEEAVLSLGGFALEGVLSDLDPEAVSGLRTQLGLNRVSIGYGRQDLDQGKFADDEPDPGGRSKLDQWGDAAGANSSRASAGRDWEDEVDQELLEEQASLSFQRRASPSGKLRGETVAFDDEDEGDDDESLAADSPQTSRFKKLTGPLPSAQHKHSASASSSSSPGSSPSLSASEIKSAQHKDVDVHEIFPTFVEGGVLEFTDLFATLPRKKQRTSAGYVNINFPSVLPSSVSTSQLLDSPYVPPTQSVSSPLRLPQMLEQAYRDLIDSLPPAKPPSPPPEDVREPVAEEEEFQRLVERQNAGSVPWKLPMDDRGWEALATQDWENDIIWTPGDLPDSSAKPLDTLTRLSRPRNPGVETGDWIQSVIFEPRNRSWKDFTALYLVPEDNEPFRDFDEKASERKEDITRPLPSLSASANASLRDHKQPHLDPFNFSNDRLYEVSKENRRRVRQTFGNLEVQHSYPAQKLQLPWYKTALTKHEARSFHRPALQFPVNIPIRFSKVKAAKKKKDKSGRKIRNTASAAELLRNTGDLSLKDTSGFMLFEYSEEAPPIMSNVGMGSIVVNYYRKRGPIDDHVPNDSFGEPFVLEVADESPFMKFGSVQPGQTVPALYNNLIRAPLFKHQPPSTDFLVIRSTSETQTNYYIRSIENLFVIGQTYPVTEVPAPNSRKSTTHQKSRLQSIAFKLCAKAPGGQIRIGQLMPYFNDQTEMQMRQRLKDFMESNRKGKSQGYWVIRPTQKVPDKEGILHLVTPEGVCLQESMQVGERQLKDAGYGKDVNIEGVGDDQSKLDTEQQLAPWITTKNFTDATKEKAMLRLYGEGDPSGRGEAFSFIRTSMKEVFLRDGETLEDRQAEIAARKKNSHRYNVNEQQDIYKQEIERIWQSQRLALSNPNPPQLTQEDELRARGNRVQVTHTPLHTADTPLPPYSAGVGTPGEWASYRRSRSPSSFSRQSSPERDDGMSMGSRNNVVGANKALKIRRLINGKWNVEVVRDPTIVNAYLRQRRLIDDQEYSTEALMPSDDPEKNRLAKKRLEEALAKLKRNQERRLARKLAKENGLLPIKKNIMIKPDVLMPISAGSLTQVRKCGHCGQMGHMKTNRRCPRWAEFNSAASGFFGTVSTPTHSHLPTSMMGGASGASGEVGGSVAGTPYPTSFTPGED